MCIGVVLYHTSNTKIISELIEYNIPLSLTTAGIMHCLTISLSLCKLTLSCRPIFCASPSYGDRPGGGGGAILDSPICSYYLM